MEKKDLDKIPSKEIYKTLSKEEQEAVLALDSMKEFKKGTLLLKEGSYHTQSFFVVRGCVRQFQLKNGVDITSEFYTEDQSVFLDDSDDKPTPSKFSLECIEDCTLSVVSIDVVKDMYKRFPRFEKMCRVQTVEELAVFQDKFSRYISSSPEERYVHLVNTRPDLLDRVPQYHLASYLGMKPESLSRIRKRLSSKL